MRFAFLASPVIVGVIFAVVFHDIFDLNALTSILAGAAIGLLEFAGLSFVFKTLSGRALTDFEDVG